MSYQTNKNTPAHAHARTHTHTHRYTNIHVESDRQQCERPLYIKGGDRRMDPLKLGIISGAMEFWFLEMGSIDLKWEINDFASTYLLCL